MKKTLKHGSDFHEDQNVWMPVEMDEPVMRELVLDKVLRSASFSVRTRRPTLVSQSEIRRIEQELLPEYLSVGQTSA